MCDTESQRDRIIGQRGPQRPERAGQISGITRQGQADNLASIRPHVNQRQVDRGHRR